MTEMKSECTTRLQQTPCDRLRKCCRLLSLAEKLSRRRRREEKMKANTSFDAKAGDLLCLHLVRFPVKSVRMNGERRRKAKGGRVRD